MIDIQLLRLMRTRADYNRITSAVNIDALDLTTKVLFNAIKQYYKDFGTHEKIDLETFMPFFENKVYPKMKPEDKTIYRNIIKNMMIKYPDEATRNQILNSVYEVNMMHKVANIVNLYEKGEDIDPIADIELALDKYKGGVKRNVVEEVPDDISGYLDNMNNDVGIRWRLACLNKNMIPLQEGHLGIIAARPDKGKTSMLASELTFMAPQLTDRPIVWFNNEGSGLAIRPRLYQAALNCTTTELISYKEDGTLLKRYVEALGGENKIRLIDVHGMHIKQIENMIDQIQPRLAVFDMIDNIKGFGDAPRNDLILEHMYQHVRELAVKYKLSGLATSQISAEGDGMMYPTLGMLKDSKTGKQGACDFQLMIGSSNDEAYNSVRWLSLPKNKVRRPTAPSYMKEQVSFDRDRARYNEITQEDVSTKNGT